jgi:hypothetical protein
MLRSRRLLLAAGAVMLLAGLSGCSTTVHMEPAEAANDPACADVSVLVPDSVAGYDRVWTDAQATAAWGEPSVALRCGVAVPAPSDLVCQTIGGVDWIVLAQEDERQRLVTYGRDPAVEVIIKRGLDIDFATVVDTISSSIQAGLQPSTARCTDRVEG